ncbi:hypothetical protein ABH935_002259 [Catenulispora sp. GAS73]|uniref:hypothetical protein n=1 Tax=Catenulispora sp. GAS73 TaxID=3156269 RepID=UPI003519D478
MNENEIRDVLGAGIGEEPPVVGGPTAVFAAARSRVVRTRAVTGTLSVAAVLGVAAGAVALSGGSGGASERTNTAGGGASAASRPGTGVPKTDQCPTSGTGDVPALSAGANPAREPEGQVPLDPRSVTELLKTALPCGTPTAYVGEDHASPGQDGVDLYGAVEVTDRAGVGSVSVSVVQHSQDQKRLLECGVRRSADRATVCENTVTQDGTTIVLEEAPDKERGGLVRTATLLFADGHEVMIEAQNRNLKFFQKAGTSATRAVPPLTLDQVRALAVDTAWPLTVSRDFAEHAKKDLVGYVDGNTVRPPVG